MKERPWHWGIGGFGSIVAMVTLCCQVAAGDAFFSEINTDAASPAGRYVEITVGRSHPTLTLGVFNAQPGTTNKPRQLLTFDLDPAMHTALVHEQPFTTISYTRSVQVDALDLAGPWGGARRLVIFDGLPTWDIDDGPPDPEQWANDPNTPDVLDAVSIVVNPAWGWTAHARLGETIVTMDPGQTAWRAEEPPRLPNDYETLNPDDPRLSPGLLNPPQMPEPSALVLGGTLGAAFLLRRSPAGPGARPSAETVS